MKRLKLFNPVNINRLAGVFQDKDLVRDVFYNLFRDTYPPSKLMRMGKQGLEEIIKEISESEGMQILQDAINQEVLHGEQNLKHIAALLFTQIDLPTKKGQQLYVYKKAYQEVRAVCGKCDKKVATGLFDSKTSLEDITFIPEQALYADNLIGLFPNNRLACDNCGNQDLHYQKIALTYVYRDKVQNKEKDLKQRVASVIQKMADRLLTDVNSRQKKYNLMEERIVNGFYRMFKSVKTNDDVNYPKLYKLFEWIRRGNLEVWNQDNQNNEQLQWIDRETRKVLKEEIFSNIPLPYAVIRTRVKEIERLYEKVLEVLYNIKGGKKEEAKHLSDLYGVRIVLTTLNDCYKLLHAMEKIPDFRILNLDDFIKKPKGERRYRSIHIEWSDGSIRYEVQIRTHELDREAETKPRLVHDNAYLAGKKEKINKIPYQIRSVVGAVLGVYKKPSASE